MPIQRLALSAAVVVGLMTVTGTAAAQGVGLGPRLSFVKGDVATTASSRFIGGTLRLQSSRRVVFEIAMDYRTRMGLNKTARFRERPVQASVLLFPVRRGFAPYVLAGFGVYSQTFDALDLAGKVIESTTTRRNGAHVGVGAEVFLGRHAALFADYRLRFVRFGDADEGAEDVNLPGSSFVPGLGGLKLSHRGSMWSSGMAFYF
jgi:hypothetical protein